MIGSIQPLDILIQSMSPLGTNFLFYIQFNLIASSIHSNKFIHIVHLYNKLIKISFQSILPCFLSHLGHRHTWRNSETQ